MNRTSKFANIVLSVLVVLTLMFLTATTVSASDVEVDIPKRELSTPDPALNRFVATTGTDSGDCTDYVNPCATINYAISKAAIGDTIALGEGVYKKVFSDLSNSIVTINKNVRIIGGWNATFSAAGSSTILDAEKIYSGINNSAANARVERIIITNMGDGQGGVSNGYGGGIILDRVSIIKSLGLGVSNQGSLEIQNTTIAQNRGGVDNANGTVVINNSTITGNINTHPTLYGGGIRNVNGNTIIQNSIVAGNTAAEAPDCYHYVSGTGSLTSAGHNIIGSTAGCVIAPATGDQFNVDPQLMPLLPLGYYPLRSASPAINFGDIASCVAVDQRGVDRLGDSQCDIGAYEHTAPSSATAILNVGPEIQRTPILSQFAHPFSFVAIDSFGSPVGGVVIKLEAPLSGPSGTFAGIGGSSVTIAADSDGLAVSPVFTANDQYGDYLVAISAPNLEIIPAITVPSHNGAWLVSNSGNNANDCLSLVTPCADLSGVLAKTEFNSGEVVWIAEGIYPGASIRNGVTIIGGWNPSFSGVGSATLINGSTDIAGLFQVDIHYIVLTGTGLSNTGADLTLEDSSIVQTELGLRNNFGGNLVLRNVTISGNGPFYPALTIDGGTVLIQNSTISGNTGFFVGGIQNYSGTVTLQNTIVAGNHAQDAGDGNNSVDCASTGGSYLSAGYNIIGTVGGRYAPDCIATWLSTDLYGNNSAPISTTNIMTVAPVQHAITGQWHYPLVYNTNIVNPALDKVPVGSGCPATDQIGVLRPQGAACDIGATEYVFRRAIAGTHDDKSNVWSFGGKWLTQNASGAYSGSYKSTSEANASAVVYFRGTQVKLYYTKNVSMGTLSVYIDDNFVTTINQKSSLPGYKKTWLSSVYPDGLHKITFVRTMGKVNVDAIQVIPAPDAIPPAAILDLGAVTGTGYGQVNLQWSAVGDDGNAGLAGLYQVRYATTVINTEAAWAAAKAFAGETPIPAASGTMENVTVSGLAPGLNYYFAVRTMDDAGNLGPLSNSPNAIALAPAPVGSGTYENDNLNWIYLGSWMPVSVTGASGTNVASSSVIGDSTALVFAGSSFTLRYYIKNGNGSLAVYVDGVLKTTIAQKSLSTMIVWKTYVASGLTPGTHVVQLVNAGGKVNFDYVIIAP